MEWTVTIEGRDDFGEVQGAQLRIEKGFERLKSGEIGLSIDDGKRIMTTLQELVVKRATYSVRNCRGQEPAMDALPTLPSSHIHGVRSSQRDLSGSGDAGINGTDRALGEHDAYRKAAELLAEFLPIEAAEGHVTVTGRSP